MNIIFDCDGTLINPFPRYFAIHKKLTKKYNLPALSYAQYIYLKKRKIKELSYIKNISSTIIKSLTRERYALDENEKYIIYDRFYPYVKKTIETLSLEHTLYIVSLRKKKDVLKKELQKKGIINCFKEIYVMQNLNKDKSLEEEKKRLLETCMQENNINSGILVGDTEIDIIAGKACKLITVGKLEGVRTKKMLAEVDPDYLIRNIKELHPVIKNQLLQPLH